MVFESRIFLSSEKVKYSQSERNASNLARRIKMSIQTIIWEYFLYNYYFHFVEMPTELSLSYTDTLIVTWSFLFEVKCYHSYIVCYTKHKLSYVLKIKATFLLHTSAGVLCFNWIQNELLKLEVCIFIQQKIKTNAL